MYKCGYVYNHQFRIVVRLLKKLITFTLNHNIADMYLCTCTVHSDVNIHIFDGNWIHVHVYPTLLHFPDVNHIMTVYLLPKGLKHARQT
jgi:hypothetical protein